MLALEGFPSHDVEHFLDTETGAIIPLHEDFEDYDELSEGLDADLGDRCRRWQTERGKSSLGVRPIPDSWADTCRKDKLQ